MGYNASQRKTNVIYDLEKSPYRYMCGDFVFYFSSETHLSKFEREVDKKILWLNDSLSRRFKVFIDTGELAAFQLYQQIEGRGFYVIDKHGNEYKNGEDVYLQVYLEVI